MKTRLLFLAMFLFTGFAFSQNGWVLDKAHSSIGFEAEHIVILQGDFDPEKGYPTVGVTKGVFQEYNVRFEPGANDFNGSKFFAQIATGSIDTDNIIRDMDLKSENFFDAEKYPNITFQSLSFEKIDDAKYKMIGELTMRGITRKMELEVMVTTVSNNLSKYVSLSATGLIDRFEYGMKWSDIFENGRFRVSQYIKLQIQTNLVNFTKS